MIEVSSIQSKKTKLILKAMSKLDIKQKAEYLHCNENHDFAWPKIMLKNMKTETYAFGGFQVISIFDPETPIDYEVLYFHGGAYAKGIKLHHFHLIETLAKSMGARVTMIDYPLAPQHEARETTDLCFELYRQMLASQKKPFIFIGDSAGGGLAMALLMMIRDYKFKVDKTLAQPIKTILYSPWLDITMENPEIEAYISKDYILSKEALINIGKKYAGDLDLKDYRVSPIYGDLNHLGDICLFYGTHELFYPDCDKLSGIRNLSATKITGLAFDDMPHDWVVIPIEERDEALAKTMEFVRGKEGGSLQKPRNRGRYHNTWRRLDNTAHIFPLISNSNHSNVFRVSMMLKQTIEPETLQKALEEALPWFPHFQSRIRKGVFWYYFEKNMQPIFQVEEEAFRPCSFIDLHKNHNYLFKVFYYKKRITLEVFHVLTDGTGAVNFIKAVTANYLKLLAGESIKLDSEVIETLGDIEDSYERNYKKRKVSKQKNILAYQIKGKKLEMYRMGLIQGFVNIKEITSYVKKKEMTVTSYLTAVYLWSIYKSEHLETCKHKPIRLVVPVNLRPFFESTTSMNFYSYLSIHLEAKDEEYTFDEIIEMVRSQFRDQIKKEAFVRKISDDVKKSKNLLVRIAPRFIKYPIVKIIYHRSMKTYTSTLSNLGKVTMPEKYADQIEHVELLLNPSKSNRIKLSVAGYKDFLTISFTSQLLDTGVQKEFFRKLAKDGLGIRIESNGVYYENL